METETQNDPQLKLAREFADLTTEKRNLNKRLDDVKSQLAEAEAKLIEILEAQGLEQVRYDDIGLITIKEPKVYASIVMGQEEILFENLRSLGREDLVKLTVNSISLASFIKEQLKEGKPAPEGSTYYLLNTLNFTAPKKN